jgi:hypothetical protein
MMRVEGSGMGVNGRYSMLRLWPRKTSRPNHPGGTRTSMPRMGGILIRLGIRMRLKDDGEGNARIRCGYLPSPASGFRALRMSFLDQLNSLLPDILVPRRFAVACIRLVRALRMSFLDQLNSLLPDILVPRLRIDDAEVPMPLTRGLPESGGGGFPMKEPYLEVDDLKRIRTL